MMAQIDKNRQLEVERRYKTQQENSVCLLFAL